MSVFMRGVSGRSSLAREVVGDEGRGGTLERVAPLLFEAAGGALRGRGSVPGTGADKDVGGCARTASAAFGPGGRGRAGLGGGVEILAVPAAGAASETTRVDELGPDTSVGSLARTPEGGTPNAEGRAALFALSRACDCSRLAAPFDGRTPCTERAPVIDGSASSALSFASRLRCIAIATA